MEKKINIKYGEGEGIERIELEGSVTMKRLNFSEKNALEEECTDIKFFGKTPQVKVSTSKMKELGLLKSIVGAAITKTTFFEDRITKNIVPTINGYEMDINGIRNLPQELGEELFVAYVDLNEVSEKKT